MISLVIFRSKNVTSSIFPLLRFSYDQANIRTYVIDPVTGKHAVFFLKSGITSPLVSFLTGILSIPWISIAMGVDVRYENDRFDQYRVEGTWEESFSIELTSDHDSVPNLAPFQDLEEATHFITGPAVGCYGASEKLIRFEVNHSAIKASRGKLSTIHCPILVSSGLLTDKELVNPQSALIAPYGRFTVFMPPALLSLQ